MPLPLKDMVRRRKLAVLMSLHELDLAQKVSDCVACVHNHTIERCGAPEEIFTAGGRPDTPCHEGGRSGG